MKVFQVEFVRLDVLHLCILVCFFCFPDLIRLEKNLSWVCVLEKCFFVLECGMLHIGKIW